MAQRSQTELDGHPADAIADLQVGVVWSEDIDPCATSPLWASVRFISTDVSQTEAARPADTSVVIEVSATPPRGREAGGVDWRIHGYRPAPCGSIS